MIDTASAPRPIAMTLLAAKKHSWYMLGKRHLLNSHGLTGAASEMPPITELSPLILDDSLIHQTKGKNAWMQQIKLATM